jgi:septum formation protein
VLATAVCAARAGIPIWRAPSSPEPTMRRFSEEFLDTDLSTEGGTPLASVGACRLEDRGVQPFSRTDCYYFAILGLPLLELLGFLRDSGRLTV